MSVSIKTLFASSNASGCRRYSAGISKSFGSGSSRWMSVTVHAELSPSVGQSRLSISARPKSESQTSEIRFSPASDVVSYFYPNKIIPSRCFVPRTVIWVLSPASSRSGLSVNDCCNRRSISRLLSTDPVRNLPQAVPKAYTCKTAETAAAQSCDHPARLRSQRERRVPRLGTRCRCSQYSNAPSALHPQPSCPTRAASSSTRRKSAPSGCDRVALRRQPHPQPRQQRIAETWSTQRSLMPLPRVYRRIDFACCCGFVAAGMGVGLYELTEVQWRRIRPLLPGRAGMVGRPAADESFVWAWRALGFALRDALAGHAGALRHIQERAQALHAMGCGWRVGPGLRRSASGWRESLRDDRFQRRAGTPTGRYGPKKGLKRALWGGVEEV